MSVREETRYGLRGYVDPDRRWYPAVGTLLDILAPMPQGWVDQEDLDLGAVMHRTLFKLAMKDEAPTANAYPRVDAAVLWLRENGLRVVEAETPRISVRAGYGGCPDALLERIRGKARVVCDFKFSEALVPRYAVQAELYRRLYQPFPQMLLLKIPKDGKLDPRWLKPNPAHFAAGINALSILNWRFQHGGNRTR